MKILLINSVLGIGSTGRIVESLYKHFTSEGHEVKVVYGRNKSDHIPASDQYCMYNKLGVAMHAGLSRVFDNTGEYSKHSTKKLLKYIDEFKPDVVNLHNLHGYYINVPMLLRYLGEHNVKCVFTLHDCWLFTGHCSYFYFNNCDGYMHGCKKCTHKNVYPKSIICSRASKNLQLKKQLLDGIKNKSFIVPSKWLKNFAEKSILACEKIDVVYNAIDYNIFNENAVNYFDKSKLPADKYILCVANYWNEQKGLNKVIELSKVLDNDYKIVMVGYLKDKSILNDNIIYIPHTDSAKELAFYYANAKVFYNPTLEDNFPTVNIESLACGTPVVLFADCSGGAEIINEDNGAVIDKDDSAEKIKYIINKCERSIKTREINERCSAERFYSKYCEMFIK